jgi:uncharacterized protein
MEILVISLAAFVASGLTLFSGFGLGTLLMPVISIFLPLEIAIAATALVHFANNIFKIGLLGKKANISILLTFGIPAIIFAILGALTLSWLSGSTELITYTIFSKQMQVTPLKLIIGILILVFVILELNPKFSAIAIEQKFLPIGGILSGFFGGLSGHQGVFRSMFLIKSGLSKDEFVATGVMLAVMVDIARMSIYGFDMTQQHLNVDWLLVSIASLSAFLGAYLGAKLLKKVTLGFVQLIVSMLLAIVAIGLIFGVL